MKLQVDREEAATWIFPLNHSKRDYQFNIIKNSLFENCLVALPTGLGKTFIAGVIMLNYYRWFPTGKVVFVAPTKPLVAQQVEACHKSCGIPGTDAVQLTGDTTQTSRIEQWKSKRVLYVTPQTLFNDLSKEACDPSDIVLLVIDEAHKATGDFAYCTVVRYLMAKNPHFRILALTATPGATPEAVQAVIDSLHISRVEIRDENSLDLRQYLHEKKLEHHVVPMNDDVIKIRDLLASIMQKDAKKLMDKGIAYINDVVKLNAFRCQMIMQELGRKPEGKANPWAYPVLKTLMDLARPMQYLMEQSIAMAYKSLSNIAHGYDSYADEDMPKSKSKSKSESAKPSRLRNDPTFQKLIKELEKLRDMRGGRRFPPHPKLDKLMGIALDHFSTYEEEHGTEGPGTRAIVFVTFRDCVDEIVEALNGHRPTLRATRFVGQGTDKSGKKGIAQKEQMGVIRRFKEGEFNIMVATSIGEEGLDIGEVDLIICYDSQKTPIRMLQRIGRTGRKRNGRIDILSAEGREEENYHKAKTTYREVQKSIVRGDQLELFADVERLIPADIKPACVEKTMEIVEYVKEDAKRTRKRKVDDDEDDGTGDKGKKKRRVKATEIPAGASSGFVSVRDLIVKGASKAKKKTTSADDDGELDEPTGSISSKSKPLSKGTGKASASTSNAPKSQKPLKRNPSLAFLSAAELIREMDDDEEDLELERGMELLSGISQAPPAAKKTTKNASRKSLLKPVKKKPSTRKADPDEEPIVIDSSPEPPRIAPKRKAASPEQAERQSSPSFDLGSDSFLMDVDLDPPDQGKKDVSSTIPQSVEKKQDMSWLLDGSDEDNPWTAREPVAPPPKPPAPAPPTTIRQYGDQLPGPFRSRKTNMPPPPDPPSLSRISLSSDNDDDDVEMSFNVKAPGGRRTGRPVTTARTDSSPSVPFPPTTGRLRKGVGKMVESFADLKSSSPPASPPRPRPKKDRVPKQNKYMSRIGHTLFGMEAEHSGDEESAGDSNGEEDPNEYDRSFVVSDDEDDPDLTGYDQDAIYRRGLMTQVPDGPAFAQKPKRFGQFAGAGDTGRRRRPAHASSSPERSGDEPDQYEFGSFVVEDDDAILELSSEQ
ncbi:3'-5' DNA helicase [Tulasnella sp. 418]|nr:3'-5' DNA helicase [Tulasnella sp. 418]